jgi:hypothetical protein
VAEEVGAVPGFVLLAAAAALAQPPAQVSLGTGLPPVHPIPPLGAQAPRAEFGSKPSVWGGRFRPFGLLPFYAGYPAIAPAVVVVAVPALPPETPAPSPAPAAERGPVRPQVSRYEWPQEEIAREGVFVIALKDSRRLRATAVWTQNGWLHLRTPEGETRRLRPAEIDRELTLKLNREAGLRFYLPPALEENQAPGE